MLDYKEREENLLGYIINNPKLINDLEIKPKYLNDINFKKLLEQLIKIYQEHNCLNYYYLEKEGCDEAVALIEDIRFHALYTPATEKENFKVIQEQILDDFKKRFIEDLHSKLQNKEIEYNEYIKRIEKTNKINISGTKENAIIKVDQIEEETEKVEHIKSNIIEFDNKTRGFALGELSIWSGSNASAKSTFLNEMAIESINQGYKVAIYSGELVPSRLLKWIIMQCAGKKNMDYNSNDNYYYVNKSYKNIIKKWLNDKLFIYNNDLGNKAKDIIEQLKLCIQKNDIRVLILDNLMSMDLKNLGDNKYETQSLLVQKLSALAKELNVHIHFVCHPRKATSFLRKEDIAGTGDLTNIADNVYIMHRVNEDFKVRTKEMFKWKEDNPIYQFTNILEICKNREFGWQDTMIGMYFEPESKRLLNRPNEIKTYGWEN
jgi:replicative DNA helicase